MDSPLEEVQLYKVQAGIQYPLLLNGSDTQNAYNIESYYSMIIDKSGKIRYSEPEVDVEEIIKKIDSLLGEN